MKQYKILVDDKGRRTYVIFDAENIKQAEQEAKAKYEKVIAIEEITPSMDLFEVI